MKNNAIYWTPRILSLSFALFLSLFATDVFNEYSGLELITALFIHLIPSLVLLAVIIIAWKYDLVGAITFIAAALFYVFAVGFDRPWSWYVFISGPAALVGLLYLLSWFQKRNKKTAP